MRSAGRRLLAMFFAVLMTVQMLPMPDVAQAEEPTTVMVGTAGTALENTDESDVIVTQTVDEDEPSTAEVFSPVKSVYQTFGATTTSTAGDPRVLEIKWVGSPSVVPDHSSVKVTATWKNAGSTSNSTREISVSPAEWVADFSSIIPSDATVVSYKITAGILDTEFYKYDAQIGAGNSYIAVSPVKAVTIRKTWVNTPENERAELGIEAHMTSKTGAVRPSISGWKVKNNDDTTDAEGIETGTRTMYLPTHDDIGDPFIDLKIEEISDEGFTRLVSMREFDPSVSWPSEVELVNTVTRVYSVDKSWTNGETNKSTRVLIDLICDQSPAVPVQTVELKSSTNWGRVNFKPVPMGRMVGNTVQPLTYSVVERHIYQTATNTNDQVENFNKEYSQEGLIFKVTNTYKTDTDREVNIYIHKTWDDHLTDAQLKANGIMMANGDRYSTFGVSATNASSGDQPIGDQLVTVSSPSKTNFTAVERLPKVNPLTGENYEYVVTEKDVPDGYISTSEVEVDSTGSIITWKFTNSSSRRDITVTKLWNDNNPQAADRPPVTLYLMRDGRFVKKGTNGDVLTNNKSEAVVITEDVRSKNYGEYTLTGSGKEGLMPAFDEATGREYVYTVYEEIDETHAAAKNYYASINGLEVTNNRFDYSTGSTIVTKEWTNPDGYEHDSFPAVTLQLYRRNKDNNTVEKLGDPFTTEGGESMSEVLTIAGDRIGTIDPNTYEYYFEEVVQEGDKWIPQNGNKFVIHFELVNGKYVGSVTITNRQTGNIYTERVRLFISKTWDISDLPEGFPSKADYLKTLTAYMTLVQRHPKADGSGYSGSFTGSAIQNVFRVPGMGGGTYDSGKEEDNIVIKGDDYIVLDVVKYDADKKLPYKYEVTEKPVAGFESFMSSDSTDNHFRFVNTQIRINIEATKRWEFVDRGNTNVSDLKLTLIRWVGTETPEELDTITIGGSAYNSSVGANGPVKVSINSHQFPGNYPSHASRYENGVYSLVPYNYKIIESVEGMADWANFIQTNTVVNVDLDAKKGSAAITNRYDKDAAPTNFVVIKEWENNLKNPPVSVIEVVKSTGESLSPPVTVTLPVKDASGNILDDRATAYNLPKYDDDGKAVTYTTKELSIGGQSLANGNIVEITNGDETRYYEYVGKTALTDGSTGETVKNRRLVDFPSKFDIYVNKVWEEGVTDAQKTAVKFVLTRNGSYYAEKTVAKSSSMRAVFSQVDYKDKKDRPYVYRAYEADPPAGFYPSVEIPMKFKRTTDSAKKLYAEMTIKNSPTDSRDLTVTKAWKQTTDTELRPKSVTVVLSYGEGSREITLSDSNSWTYTFRNLPVYTSSSSGVPVTYTVTEKFPSGSNHEIDSITCEHVTNVSSGGNLRFTLVRPGTSPADSEGKVTVTNRLQTTTSATGKKRWVGDSDEAVRNANRPMTIKVVLKGYVDGVTEPISTSAARDIGRGSTTNNMTTDEWAQDNWEWNSGSSLPKFYESGGVSKKIRYVWEETGMTPAKNYTVTNATAEGDGSTTIINTIEFVTVQGSKTWVNGSGNKFSFVTPPTSTNIDIKLVRKLVGEDDSKYDTVPNSARTIKYNNGWKWNADTWKEITLPKYDTTGKQYVYAVEETSSFTGYEKTHKVSTLSGSVFTSNVTNTLITAPLRVTKNWYGDNGSGRTTINIKVSAEMGGSPTVAPGTREYTGQLKAAGSWTTTSYSSSTTEFPVYDWSTGKAVQIKYKVTETAVPTNYTFVTVSGTDPNFVFTPVEAGKEYVENILLNLNKTEKHVNIHNAKLSAQLKFKKVWDDSSNELLKRPTSISFKLQRRIGSGAFEDYAASKPFMGTGDTWDLVWPDSVPQSGTGGNYEYRVVEDSVPFYSTTNNTSQTDLLNATLIKSDGSGSVTNKLSAASGISGSKTWNRNSVPDAEEKLVRPPSIKLTLKYIDADDKTGIATDSTGKQIKNVVVPVSDTDAGSWIWPNVMGNDSQGRPYKKFYVVEDKTNMTGYVTPLDEDPDETKLTMNATNKLKKVSITVEKEWTGDGDDSVRPNSIKFTLYGSVPTSGVAAHKADFITREATMNKAGGWQSVKFDNLPLYDTKDGTARQITYQIAEEEIKGYDLVGATTGNRKTVSITATEIAAGTATIKMENKRKAGNISVTKTWIGDNNDKDGTRPASITYSLKQYKTDGAGNRVGAATSWTSPQAPITVTAPWGQQTFTGVPLYDPDGNLYDYDLVEGTVAGYKAAQVTPVKNAKGEITSFSVINELNPSQLSFTKKWNDNTNAAGIRPTALKVNLYRRFVGEADNDTNNKFVGTKTFQGASVATEADPSIWAMSWDSMPTHGKNEAGENKEYIYKFVEVDVRKEYSMDTPSCGNGGQMKNTLTTIRMPGKKAWTGELSGSYTKGLASTRPDTITVRLMRAVGEGTPVKYGDDITVSIKDGVDTWAFENLPKFSDAQASPQIAYVYTVVEVPTSGNADNAVNGYDTPAYANKDGYTPVVTNTVRKVNIKVTKEWLGDTTSVRPTTLPIKLVGTVTGDTENSFEIPYTLEASKNWTYTFTNLPTHYKTKQITYTVTETKPAGYMAGIDGGVTYPLLEPASVAPTGKEENGLISFVLTNKLGTGAHVFTKEWKEGTAISGLTIRRPSELKIQLWRTTDKDLVGKTGQAGTTKVETYTIDARGKNPYTQQITGLQMEDTKTGDPYYFWVVEESTSATGYTPTHYYEDSGNTVNLMKVTNTMQTVDLVINKTWTDELEREIDGTIRKLYTRPTGIPLTIKGVAKGSSPEDVVFTRSMTLTGSTTDPKWTHTISGLPKYTYDSAGKNPVLIQYTVTETATAFDKAYTTNNNATKMTASASATEYVTELTNTLKTKDVTVSKKFIGDEGVINVSGVLSPRPSTVTLELRRRIGTATGGIDNTFMLSKTIDIDTKAGTVFTHKFEKLPTHSAKNEEYFYYVTENPVPTGYGPGVDPDDPENPLKISNSLDSVTVTGTKYWTDITNEAGETPFRPVVLELTLRRRFQIPGSDPVTDSYSETIKINREHGAAEQTFEKKGLARSTPNGLYTYEYYLEEKQVDGYTTTYDAPVVDEDGNTVLNVRNVMDSMSLRVYKEWAEGGTPDPDSRPEDGIAITLYGKIGSETKFTDTAVLKADTTPAWSHTFVGLPKKINGVSIEYVIEEAAVPGYFLQNASEKDGNRISVIASGAASMEAKLINERRMGVIEVSKLWKNEGLEADNTRPSSINFVITQYEENKTTATGVTRDGTLTKNVDGSWTTATFDDLPESYGGNKSYYYSLVEDPVPGGYESEVVRLETNGRLQGFRIENTLKPITLSFTKEWDDSGVTSMRPSDNRLQFQLLRKASNALGDPVPYGVPLTLEAKTTTGNLWTFEWPEQVPAYSQGEVPYTYYVEEATIPVPYNAGTRRIEIKAADQENITNVLNLVDVKGTKEWSELAGSEYPGGLASLRPDSITVHLYRNENGIDRRIDTQVVDTSSTGNNQWLFENLPEYEVYPTKKYQYWVQEDPATIPTGYTSTRKTVTTTETGYDSSLSNRIKTVNVEVAKTAWGDAGHEAENPRPATLNVTVTGTYGPLDKTFTVSKGLTEAMGWKHTFVGLPLYIEGEKVTYSVTEQVPPGYASGTSGYPIITAPITPADDVSKISFTIQNSLQETAVTFTKVWQEGTYNWGKRPTSITVELWRTTAEGDVGNKSAATSTKVGADRVIPVPNDGLNQFTYEFSGLLTSEGDKTYHYWVEEKTVVGYTAIDTDKSMVVTNKLNTVTVNLKKVWSGKLTHTEGTETTTLFTLPEKITLRLVGEAHGTTFFSQDYEITPPSGNPTATEWTRTIEGLPRYAYNASGVPTAIRYKVTELPTTAAFSYAVEPKDGALMDDATASFELKVTNTLQTAPVKITKTFTGDKDAIDAARDAGTASPRPATITVRLRRDAGGAPDAAFEIARAITVTDAKDTYEETFADLPTHNWAGVAYTYYVVEDAVAGYSQTAPKGLTLVNDLNGVNIKVVKRWDDDLNRLEYPIRPREGIDIGLERSVDGGAYERGFVAVQHIDYDNRTQTQEVTFVGLPTENAAQRPYTYRAYEIGPDGAESVKGYTLTRPTSTTDNGVLVLNLLNTINRVTVEIDKHWEEATEALKLNRPTSLAITLTGTGDDDYVYYVGTRTINEPSAGANTWQAVFENLPRYGYNGELITYVATEAPISNYVLKSEVQPTSSAAAAKYTGSLTNEQGAVSIKLRKEWSDELTRTEDGGTTISTRPPVVTLYITGKAGENVVYPKTGYTLSETLYGTTDPKIWEREVSGLPMYGLNEEGAMEAITYTITEPSEQAYSYVVTPPEVKVVSGTVEYTATVKNTLVVAPVTITKVFTGDEDAIKEAIANSTKSPRPLTITVHLKRDGEVAGDPEFKLTRTIDVTDTQDTYTEVFTGLPTHNRNNGAYTYYVEEDTVPGYAQTEPKGLKLVNEMTGIDIKVVKVWDDDLNRGEYPARPRDGITVGLERSVDSGAFTRGFVATQHIDYDNRTKTQEVIFTGLPTENDAGRPYTYRAYEIGPDGEEGVKGYTLTRATTTTDADGKMVLNLTNTVNRVTVEIDKHWEEATEALKLNRPTSLTITLTGTGDDDYVYYLESKTINAPSADANTWQAVFENLPRYGYNGELITYVATEAPISNYVLKEETQPTSSAGAVKYTGSLTNEQGSVSITLQKKWKDELTRTEDGGTTISTRPIVVTIYVTGKAGERVAFPRTGYTLSETNNGTTDPTVWEREITGLPMYGLNEENAMEAITYTIEELDHDAYSSKVEPPYVKVLPGTSEYEVEVANTLVTAPVSISKTFTGDEDAIREALAAGVKSPRPLTITVHLKRDGEVAGDPEFKLTRTIDVTDTQDTYTEVFTGLPTHNRNKGAYTYYVEEDAVPGYAQIEPVAPAKSRNLVNEMTGIDIKVVKRWDDDLNRLEYPVRPLDGITIGLERSVDSGAFERGFVATQHFDYDNRTQTQETVFYGLPTENDAGRPYTYRAYEIGPDGEEGVKGYTLTRAAQSIDGDGVLVLNLTNTLNRVSVEVTKNWIEANASLKIYRPSSLTITLTGTGDGGHVYYVGNRTATPGAQADAWTVQFDNLPRYGYNGELITYTATEDPIANYALTDSTPTTPNATTPVYAASLTNEQSAVSITVEKVWDDELTREIVEGEAATTTISTRPASVTVHVTGTANGKEVHSQDYTLNATDNGTVDPNKWSRTIDGLPRAALDNANEMVPVIYTVTEPTQTAYTYKVDPPEVVLTTSTTYTVTVTNTLTTQNVSATKKFEGDAATIANGYSARPTSITVHLLRDGGVAGEAAFKLTKTIDILTTQDDYTITFEDLPVRNRNGGTYTYYVEEDTVPGYEQTAPKGLALVNKLEGIEVTVNKVWRDDLHRGAYLVRPDYIDIKLMRSADGTVDDKFSATQRIAYDDEVTTQSVTFVGLAKNNTAGRPYTYFAQEIDPNGNEFVYGYTTVKDPMKVDADTGNASLTLTNTLNRVKVQVEKFWLDTPETRAFRPESGIIMTITGTGEDGILYHQSNMTLRPDPMEPNKDSWEGTFINLPRYGKDGNLITYVVTETAPSNYEQVTSLDVQPESSATALTYYGALSNQERKITLNVHKDWKDELTRANNGGTTTIFTRPTEIELVLTTIVNGDSVATRRVSMNSTQHKTTDPNIWTIVLDDLPLYARDSGGNLGRASYRITEPVQTAYTYVVSPPEVVVTSATAEYDATVTNTLDTQAAVTITKTFEGDSQMIARGYSPRPDSITVNLQRRIGDGGAIDPTFKLTETITMVDGKNNYDFDFTDLPKRNWAGTEYVYFVTENPVNGYTQTLPEGLALNNKLDVIEVSGEKKWEDFNYDGTDYPVRPSSIVIRLTRRVQGASAPEAGFFLLSDPIAYNNATSTQGWTFDNLAKFDRVTGNAYDYMVEELDPDDNVGVYGYDNTVSQPTRDGDGNLSYTITNTLDKVSVTVRKVWTEADASLKAYRPLEGIDVTLTGTGDNDEVYFQETKNIAFAAGDTWTVLYENLPRIGRNDELIVYEATEVPPVNYELISETQPTSTKNKQISGYTATLQNRQKTFSLVLNKIWEDELFRDNNGRRARIFTRPEKITVNVVGKVNGDEIFNQDYEMTGDAEGATWTRTIPNLPYYAYDKQGSRVVGEITYTITEETSAAYTSTPRPVDFTPVVGTATYTVEITNELNVDDVSITKEFIGDEPMITRGYSPRPDDITVNLQRRIGVGGSVDATFRLIETITMVDGKNDYDFTFLGLPTHKWTGEEYEYFVTENTVNGYREISTENLSLINELITIDIAGEKTWDDDLYKGDYPVRPKGGLTIELTRRIGANAPEAGFLLTYHIPFDVGETVQPWNIDNLARYDRVTGGEYTYEAREVGAGNNGVTGVYGYKDSMTKTPGANGNLTIDFVNVLDRVNVEVRKHWSEQDESLKAYRPLEGIEIYLKGTGDDGTVYYEESQTAMPPAGGLTASPWSVTFENLPRVGKNNELIEYETWEDEPINYELYEEAQPVENRTAATFAASLRNRQKTFSLVLNKIWDDELFRDNNGRDARIFTRPDKITVNVAGTVNGDEIFNQNYELTARDNTVSDTEWSRTIPNLPYYAYDKQGSTVVGQITYTITEQTSLAYTTAPDPQQITPLVGTSTYTVEITNELNVDDVSITKEFIGDELMIERGYSPRPDDITVNLQRRIGVGGKVDATFRLIETITMVDGTDDYGFTFENLPTHAWTDEEYEYFVTENKVNGYREISTENLSLINELITIDIAGEKTWDDDLYKGDYPVRPKGGLTIELTRRIGANAPEAGFLLTYHIPFDLSATVQPWNIDSLARYDRVTGGEYTYEAREVGAGNNGVTGVYGYKDTMNKTPGANGNLTIDFVNVLDRVNVEVRKHWSEPNASLSGLRPAEGIEIYLKGTGNDGTVYYEESQTAMPPVGNASSSTWTVLFENLPRVGKNNELIEYETWEDEPINYELYEESQPIENLNSATFPASLRNRQKTFDLTLEKIWDDEEFRENNGTNARIFTRPAQITVNVVGTVNGDEVFNQDYVLTARDNTVDGMTWSRTIKDLPYYMYDKQGSTTVGEVTYTITEETSLAYTTTSDTQTLEPEVGTKAYTVKITNEINVDDVEITKLFENDAVMIERGYSPRPDSITVNLQRRLNDGGPIDTTFKLTETIAMVDGKDEYAYTFENLPTHAWTEEEYVYFVTELPVNGYEQMLPEGLDLLNRLIVTEVSGMKEWDDDLYKGTYPVRPKSITIELLRQVGSQPEEDFILKYNIPYNVTVTEQTWQFTDLNKYDKVTGSEYRYTVREVGAENDDEGVYGYKHLYERVVEQDGIIYYVKNELDRIDIIVEHYWEEDEGYEEYRPYDDGLPIHLTGTGKNGEVYYDETRIATNKSRGALSGGTSNNAWAPGDLNVWSVTFENVPRVGRDGELIEYLASEDEMAPYDVDLDRIEQPVLNYTDSIFYAKLNTFLKKVEYGGSKTWVDEENKHRTRPENIVVELQRDYQDKTTKQTETEIVESVTVTAPWNWNFTGLPEYHKGGTIYSYKVVETNKDGRYAVTNTNNDPMSLTNTLITQDVTVKKVWQDEDGKFERILARPTTVTVSLTPDPATGVKYTGAVSSIRNWEFVFSGLPKYTKDGTLVKYTLAEEGNVDGYTIGTIESPQSSETGAYTGTITNVLETVDVTVNKVWSGGTDRPDVTVRLMDGTYEVDTITLNAGNNWTHTFKGVPKTRNSAAIQYTVAEVSVTNYTTAIESTTTAQGFSFVITNTYNPPATPTPRPSSTARPGGSTTPRPGTTTSVPGQTVPPNVTPSPTPRRDAPNYTTLLDLDIPLGYGSSLNLGDCFD